ncbi:MAG TPA: hypothetical protein VLC09_07530 [Polyangiaceae bacterium]|nr:hypothetical protein [Polyangiaceae bacterium]
MPRPIESRYEDPLETVWLECARRVGLQVSRAPDAYASSDGRGGLVLSDATGLDADDSLAQMILHELCHALVQGPESFAWIDWGLDNEGNRDDELEHACLRVQAALLEPLGLRQVLAPTTDFRAYYDRLPPDPFEERERSERTSITRGRLAYARRHHSPWAPHLDEALAATARIVEATGSYASGTALLAKREAATPAHRLGPASCARPNTRCGDCAWTHRDALDRLSCELHRRRRVVPDERACELFEPELDCTTCGACCREAYDVVVVARSDPAPKRHLDLFVARRDGYDLPRPDGLCVALRGGERLAPIQPAITRPSRAGETGDARDAAETKVRYQPDERGFSCVIYDDRPRTCRDFRRGSPNCREARRAVGLGR